MGSILRALGDNFSTLFIQFRAQLDNFAVSYQETYLDFKVKPCLSDVVLVDHPHGLSDGHWTA